MNTAHNDDQTTFSFEALEFPRRVNTVGIIRQAEQYRAEEIARLGRVFGRFLHRALIAPLVVAYKRQRMHEELSQLSDRALYDIGISRFNISDIVKDAFPIEAETTVPTAKTTAPSAVATQAAPEASNDQTHQPLAA
ncbi:MAG: DUF1127 domain-containing protein [Rhodospirillales bacterium]|nr:DUF1127 domain-containing protein [Rhodospirillales bacterium]